MFALAQSTTWKFPSGREKKNRENLPWYSTTFHVVCQGDVITPDVELPLPQAEDPAMNPASVYSHSHVHVHGTDLSIEAVKVESIIQGAMIAIIL